MKFSKINLFCVCVVGLILIAPVYNAPRSRPKGQSIKFDQTQSGDYNIQVRLKDIHIILGDDPFGGYGDYDYNYDYSDLTVKPILPVTTVSPVNSTNSPEVPEVSKPEGNSEKPNDHPYEIVSPSTLRPNEIPPAVTATPQPLSPESEKQPEKSVNTTEKATTPKSEIQSTEESVKPSTTQKVEHQKATKNEDSETVFEKKTEASITNISIVPSENAGIVENDQRVPLGEIMHYRKCGNGYARDKQGRCRKIRRTPQLPFGLSRFASNLASRFRQATSGESSLSQIR